MKNLQKHNTPRLPQLLLVVSVAGLLGSCGGSGTGSNNSSGIDPGTTPDTSLVELANRSMSGTVVIAERDGKTVFDGWFTQTSQYEADAGPSDTTISQDQCKVSSVHSDAANKPPVELGAAQAANEFASVGQSLHIDSRLGEFESLVKQQVGDTTVYAPEDRWKSEALPDDAVLSFEVGSGLGQMGSITVPPIMPLVWIAPESGVMTSAASSLRWEPSFSEHVKIKLRLSAIDFSDSENPAVVSVSCDLIDDGLYTLPAEFQQLLPDDDMGISVYAVREYVQQIRNGNSNLNVVQLSYPSPVKP